MPLGPRPNALPFGDRTVWSGSPGTCDISQFFDFSASFFFCGVGGWGGGGGWGHTDLKMIATTRQSVAEMLVLWILMGR